MFPFTLKYSRPLSTKYNAAKTSEAFDYLEQFIKDKSGEDFTREGDELHFKVRLFRLRSRSNILGMLNKGKFKIVDNVTYSTLEYECSIVRFFAIMGGMIVLTLGVVQSSMPTVAYIIWPIGIVVNWIVVYVRHRWMMNEIVKKLEKQ